MKIEIELGPRTIAALADLLKAGAKRPTPSTTSAAPRRRYETHADEISDEAFAKAAGIVQSRKLFKMACESAGVECKTYGTSHRLYIPRRSLPAVARAAKKIIKDGKFR